MLVRVYKNLHKNCLSVQAKVNGRWKVIKHVNSIYLEDVEFKVSQAGRKRVLHEGRKNVHAFVVGRYSYVYNNAVNAMAPTMYNVRRVKYNPYRSGHFTVDNQPVLTAKAILVSDTMLAIM